MNKNIPTPLAILIIFLVIVTIVVVAFLLCPEGKKVLFQDEASEIEFDIASTTTRTETDYGQSTSTGDWQTYRNEECGFEIKYPSNFCIENNIETTNYMIIQDCELKKELLHNPEIVIKIINSDLSLRNYLNKTGNSGSLLDEFASPGYTYYNVKDIKDITLNNITALQFFSAAVSDSSINTLIKIPQENIIINIIKINSGLGNFPDDIYKQILSTFRFTESVETCVDNCGNGICEEVVCLAIGCPCAETPESCPEDCGAKTEPENLQLEIKDFNTDKETYTSNEELKVSLTILSLGDVERAVVRLVGIKPYSYAYINSAQTVDLITGENEIIFAATTPNCTSGCGGVYPGPYDLNAEVFIEENLITSSTISITLTNN
ncbi:MAG TPA: hypothetical protein VMV66_01625 [Candidatus Humimicrobiaceae bacterium]|nr:hypothetical protein [Candidatus Humimicrobiaceae bacterium]